MMPTSKISKTLLGVLILSATVCSNKVLAMPVEDLHLEHIEDYPLNASGEPLHFFLVSNSRENARVVLNSKLMGEIKVAYPGDKIESSIRADIQCNNGVVFNSGSLFSNDENITSRQFTLFNGNKTSVTLSPQVDECVLTFFDRLKPARRGGVRLVRENKAFPFILSLNQYREGCNYQIKSGNMPIQNVFLTPDFRNMTCAHAADSIETLETPESGFLAKAEALLGSKIDVSFIKNGDPYAPLDFSHVPKLDAVYVASLVFRHDFYGTVITRLLKYHADRGTLVNVMTTGYMQSDKDRDLLYTAARENGNFRLQEYTYHDPKGGLKSPGRLIDNAYRDMHIKLFVTLSSTEPENNILVLGGRNIHDGFLYREKPDHSRFPELTQYGADLDENFVHWSDFEIRIKSPQIARSIYSHLLTFWNRDTLTQKLESINLPADGSPLVSGLEVLNSPKPMMRHIISVPFEDDHALEKLFVKMIDGAQSTIQLSSPYLRPTKAITHALERAVLRKVKVTIQTRIDLKGDTQAWLYTEVNKESINNLYAKTQIYEWTKNSILHSKFILVDGRVAFVGSVNLSRRSFIQDIENGFVIHDETFVKKMQTIFEGYTSQSRLITKEQNRKFWGTLFSTILQDQF